MDMKTPVTIKLETFWPYQIAVLADQIARHLGRILRAHGDLNLSQWRVMAAIGEQAGRSAADVVAVTPMDKGIVSRAVTSLIEAEMVRREMAPDDRRKSHLYLTEKGLAQYQAISLALLTSLKDIHPSTELAEPISHLIQQMNERLD